MIRFLKVSESQWQKDCAAWGFSKEATENLEAFHAMPLPVRKTKGSAGYDFVSPVSVTLKPGEGCAIPTGIRAIMPNHLVLMLVPRSGLGVRYRLQLSNTVGIIDSDYAQSENEGHIIVHLTNDGKEERDLHIKAGDRFIQGLFIAFYCTDDDHTASERNGGFGSTDAG